jgi:hypothetical protein
MSEYALLLRHDGAALVGWGGLGSCLMQATAPDALYALERALAGLEGPAGRGWRADGEQMCVSRWLLNYP